MSATLTLTDRTVDLLTGRVSTGASLRPLELKVLAYLARRPGITVAPAELLRQVWGYAPAVRTRTVYVTLYRLRTSIEADPAHPRHLVTVPRVGVRLELDAPEVVEAPSGPRDGFVGREAELAALDAVGDGLVTLVGPSGIGKTRLAGEWARRAGRPHWFVDARDADPDELWERIGRALRAERTDVGPTLARAPGIVVLDDLSADDPRAALAVLDVLSKPGVTVVVTAPAALGLSGERVVPVPPLGTDADGAAVRLLVDRIRAAGGAVDGAGAGAEADGLVELAVAVDGVPLAVEIAAGHAAAFGLDGALAALRRHRSLAGRRRDLPDRHRSIEAMLESTWDHLPAWARSACAQLAVFGGAFTLALAERVIRLPDDAPPATAAIGALVERGLIAPSPGRPGRYRLFDTVRWFVRDRSPDDDGARGRWLDWFRAAAAELLVDGPGLGLASAAADREDVDAWIEAARGSYGDPDRLPVVVRAYVIATYTGRGAAAHHLGDHLDRCALDRPCLARYLAAKAVFALRFEPAESSLALAREVADACVDWQLPVCAAEYLFTAAVEADGPDRALARDLLARGNALRLGLRCETAIARQLDLLASSAESGIRNGLPEAVIAGERVLGLLGDLGVTDVCWARIELSRALASVGRLASAEHEARQAVAVAPDYHRVRALAWWAHVLNRREERDDAREILGRAVEEADRCRWVVRARVLLGRAEVRLGSGDLDGAEDDARQVLVAGIRRHGQRIDGDARLMVARVMAARRMPAAVPVLEDLFDRALARTLVCEVRETAEVLSAVHAAAGRWDTSEAVVARALDAVGPSEELVRAAVELRWRRGEPAEALALLDAVARPTDETYQWAPFAVAALQAALGRPAADPGPASGRWARLYLARAHALSRSDLASRDGVAERSTEAACPADPWFEVASGWSPGTVTPRPR
ncbi:MAG: winged helix-turn-helix domain-containing protein [Myxococcota bacterium]